MRRKFITGMLLVFVGLAAMPGMAQQPFLEDGKAWSQYVYDMFTKEGYTATYFLKGDTTVGEYKYFKSWYSLQEDYMDRGGLREFLYREKDGKVYVYNTQTKKEYLMYDFTMQPGDSFIYEANQGMDERNSLFKLTLKSIRDIVTPYPTPVKRKVWDYIVSMGLFNSDENKWYYPDGGFVMSVLEGIGSPSCCGIDAYPFDIFGPAFEFRCCHDGTGKVIYTVDEEGWCYRYTLGIDEVKDEEGGLKVTESAGGRLAFAWNAGAGYRTLSLYSAEGRLVARRRPAAGDTSAAFTGLPRGVYLYYFTAGGQTKAAGKVLVE